MPVDGSAGAIVMTKTYAPSSHFISSLDVLDNQIITSPAGPTQSHHRHSFRRLKRILKTRRWIALTLIAKPDLSYPRELSNLRTSSVVLDFHYHQLPCCGHVPASASSCLLLLWPPVGQGSSLRHKAVGMWELWGCQSSGRGTLRLRSCLLSSPSFLLNKLTALSRTARSPIHLQPLRRSMLASHTPHLIRSLRSLARPTHRSSAQDASTTSIS